MAQQNKEVAKVIELHADLRCADCDCELELGFVPSYIVALHTDNPGEICSAIQIKVVCHRCIEKYRETDDG